MPMVNQYNFIDLVVFIWEDLPQFTQLFLCYYFKLIWNFIIIYVILFIMYEIHNMKFTSLFMLHLINIISPLNVHLRIQSQKYYFEVKDHEYFNEYWYCWITSQGNFQNSSYCQVVQDGSLVIQQIFNVYLLHTSTVSVAGKCKSVRKTEKRESTTTGGSRRFPRRPGPHSRPAVKCAGAVF